GVISKRDLFRALQGRFHKVVDMEPALNLLVTHGHLREEERPRTGSRGKPPSPRYFVNPFSFPDAIDSIDTVDDNPPDAADPAEEVPAAPPPTHEHPFEGPIPKPPPDLVDAA